MADTAAATSGASDELVGWRRTVDRVYVYVLTLFMVGVVVQFFLAGLGVFGDHAKHVKDASSFDPHRALGHILGAIAVVIFLLAIAARESRRTWIGALVLAILAFVLQSVLAGVGEDHQVVGGLHALDGIVITFLAGWLTAAAHVRERARRGP